MSNFWKRLTQVGPGAVVAAAFIGPGTVTTCTVSGVSYGYTLLWALLFSTISVIVLQSMASKLGIVKKVGLGEALREKYTGKGVRILLAILVIGAVFIGNVAYETGNISGGILGLQAIWPSLSKIPVAIFVFDIAAGLLLSDEVVNGVVGHNHYDVVAFGNFDILPAENVAIGFEYKQGVDAGDGIRNHDYWDAHVAWFVTKKLTLVAAFAETGDKDKFYRRGSAKNLGVGSGAVFSLQYQF